MSPPPNSMPQENGSVQFSLGKLEMASARTAEDINSIRNELRDLPKIIRSELKSEIKEALEPIEARIVKLEVRVGEAYDTILKWRAMIGIIALLAGAFGAIISNLSTFKRVVGGL